MLSFLSDFRIGIILTGHWQSIGFEFLIVSSQSRVLESLKCLCGGNGFLYAAVYRPTTAVVYIGTYLSCAIPV